MEQAYRITRIYVVGPGGFKAIGCDESDDNIFAAELNRLHAALSAKDAELKAFELALIQIMNRPTEQPRDLDSVYVAEMADIARNAIVKGASS